MSSTTALPAPLNIESDFCLSRWGGCHVFAIAAARLMDAQGRDWRIVGIFRTDEDDDDNPESGLFNGYTNVAHFYVEDEDGNCFDADGEFDPDRYIAEKEMDTGWSLDTCPADEDDIARLAEMGWLSNYNDGDLAVAAPLVREVLEGEDVDFATPGLTQ